MSLQPTPPKEPFAYISKSRGLFTFRIREPWVMALFFLLLTAVGVLFYSMTLEDARAGNQGAKTAGPLILGIFGLVGVIGFAIAVVRWRWKREYVRVMGRSPWA